ncbi:NUDIX hydrolase [Actinomadura luteofluorescens]|uniref:NUDIX hydrolase n=1 Tax=Actinomadura luteofluorescens TaxID=46163 RepID=UPI003632A8DD
MSAPSPGPFDDLAAFRALAAERLGSFAHTRVPEAPGLRRAGVVLCAVEHDGVPSMIVIRRAYQGRNAGQWGLPGGRMEDGETPEQAALRELHEELGLTAGPADVLGRLDDFPAASGFAITPVVVVLDDPGPLAPSPDEVHSVHHTSLRRSPPTTPRSGYRSRAAGAFCRCGSAPGGASTRRPARCCGSSARWCCSAGPPGSPTSPSPTGRATERQNVPPSTTTRCPVT